MTRRRSERRLSRRTPATTRRSGLTIAARAIERGGGVSAELAWWGVGVALITTVFGLCIFILALLLWMVLRHMHARVLAGS